MTLGATARAGMRGLRFVAETNPWEGRRGTRIRSAPGLQGEGQRDVDEAAPRTVACPTPALHPTCSRTWLRSGRDRIAAFARRTRSALLCVRPQAGGGASGRRLLTAGRTIEARSGSPAENPARRCPPRDTMAPWRTCVRARQPASTAIWGSYSADTTTAFPSLASNVSRSVSPCFLSTMKVRAKSTSDRWCDVE